MAQPEYIRVRREIISDTRRVVIKVGSRLLTGPEGTPGSTRIHGLVRQIAGVMKPGREVILVSSGAIGAGMAITETAKRPRDLAKLQALAAIGQSRLMSLYQSACQRHGFHCAQILLSADDVTDRKRHLNVCNCLNALLHGGILPIVNENDSVSVDEIRFGDNDRLAALVATMVQANLTILLTTVDGLHKREKGRLTERIPIVDRITNDVQRMAAGTDDRDMSIGGMVSKLNAAEICVASGESLWIADGRDAGVLDRIFAADDVGTLFLPRSNRLTGAKRYLAFFTEPSGHVDVDAGAAKALCKSGKSLLPSGITTINGKFAKGDTIIIRGPNGVKIAMGVTNYHARELDKIKGLRSSQIAKVLEKAGYDEAVHRDNMVVW